MAARRAERAQADRRVLLQRAVAQLEAEGWGALAPLAETGLRSLDEQPEGLLFLDEDDLRDGFLAVLGEAGLVRAVEAWAAHLEEEGELWRRRLRLQVREPRLAARRAELDEAWRQGLRAHFTRWGAAGPAGARTSALEAELVLAALRGAQRLWVEGQGRPVLPVLAQEALATLWPALYAHARKGR